MKCIIKRLNIIIAAIVFVILVIYLISNAVLVYRSLYFPNQEKKFKVEIQESNMEAEIRVYVDNKAGNDLNVTLSEENGEIQELEKQNGTKEIMYFKKAEAGKEYIVKVKNRTDSFVYSYVIVENNN
ncbi:hypothetical protein JZO66_04030 [Enterococcus sp. DIV0242_7C1]|uniref:Uncharacterized protein n=1 Tax=Candidatus Enterococcus dunnyi TaxID=1834192 RepID=A0AAQ3W4K9_9ENTE|nr:hypothetical protein [Enterococcus sp. DIV0242_7C1]MBO0469703.1 hypothetical protein [Enterococcus sp. DIV0242_7C1]